MPTDNLYRSGRSRFHGVSRPAHLCVAAALLLAPFAWPQGNPAGHWEGVASMGPQQTRLSLDLAKNAKSEWEASMGVPAENMTGLVVTDVAVNGNGVQFVAVELMMAKFDLTLGPDGAMKGTISTQQGPSPVEFRRTSAAKVELIAPSPAVSKELEGEWEGAFQAAPNASFPVVFRFKNRSDGTVAATIDSPARDAMGMPLDNVKQAGEKVEFGVKIANASFSGALNREGTELAGQFTHDGQSVPMTLRKK